MRYLTSLFAKIRTMCFFKRGFLNLTEDQPNDAIFFDLAPVDNADNDGTYRQALDFAMRNPAVRNIALTGPFGSGKTSIIKTYERESNYRFLNVSLATFNDPNTTDESVKNPEEVTVKVERSILQQMLYGADNSTLPYSRFKRISKPRRLDLNATAFVGWLIACGYLYINKDRILATTALENLDMTWVFTAAFASLYLARLISKSLQASHSLSIKKLSLQNGEVELDSTPESSILNKHLDEIIYFFEENDYDLVVFEDLDRFGNPEIFIKLREINKIINDGRTHKKTLFSISLPKPIKFLYAIKDDVFFNRDRAKFFDFITPVIPIINNSNSREMLARCVKSGGPDKKLDSRFLSEVSLYLDDFRLIKNISNEFLIYECKVGGVPNLNKLLAIIVYKNTYPRDFEALHHGRGALFRIVEKRAEAIAKVAVEVDSEIQKIKDEIRSSENELCQSQEELVKIFWGELCREYKSSPILGVYAGENIYSVDHLLEWDNFQKLFGEKKLRIQANIAQYYGQQPQEVALGLSFREFEEKAIPGSKFESRYGAVKDKTAQRRQQLNLDIDRLKEKKSEFARRPLRELLRGAGLRIDELAKDSGIDDSRLLNYLIGNGYLDETYHLYISIFHEGRMSRNDWNFIQTIRDFRAAEPFAPIDNPKEVVSEMRDEDFGAEYVLNVLLVEHLLQSAADNRSKIESAVGFISKNFHETEEFFQAYWMSGKNVREFTKAISTNWQGYAVAAVDSDLAVKHIAAVLTYVEPSYIANYMNIESALGTYLSNHLALVYSENVMLGHSYEALQLMSVEVGRLQDIIDLENLFDFIVNASLYSLTVENVGLVLSKFPAEMAHEQEIFIDRNFANYTSIKHCSSQALKKYIDENINSYLINISMAMQENLEESESSILEVINHSNVDEELAIQFALRQKHIFENFEEIPASMWGGLLFGRRIDINWSNLLRYHSGGIVDSKSLSSLLDQADVYSRLSGSKIPKASPDDEQCLELSRFLIHNTDINLKSFEALCHSIPYTFQSFPKELPDDRKLALAKTGVISLNETSFLDSSIVSGLRTTLIKTNFSIFEKNVDKFTLDTSTKAELLEAKLSADQSNFIISRITLEELTINPSVTKLVGRYLALPDVSRKNVDKEIVSYCLLNTEEHLSRKGILYNFVDQLTNEQITKALTLLPEPECLFVKPNSRPRMARTEKNLLFVKKLATRKIVSSVSEETDFIRINTFRKGFLSFLGE